MKHIAILFGTLTVMLAATFWLLFTQSGNNIIKPYIQEKISEKIQKDVVLDTFTLKTNFIDVEMSIDRNTKVIVNGDFSIFNKKFDLDYVINSKDLDTPFVKIDGKLDMKGQAVGDLRVFSINGVGEAFRSQIRFATSVENKQLKNLKLDAKSVKIEDILTFVKQPIYTRGMLDVNADIQGTGENIYKGDANILIHYGTMDNGLLKKDFGVDLPLSVTYKGTVDAKIDGDKLQAVSSIVSNIMKLNTTKTQFDVKSGALYSDYKLYLPNLSVFENTIKTPIQGNLLVEGNIKKDKTDLAVDAHADTLGGKFSMTMLNNILKAELSDMSLAKITHMLKKPKYSDGVLNLIVDMEDISKEARAGKVDVHVSNAKLYGKTLKEFSEMNFPDVINYDVKANSEIDKDIADYKIALSSDIANLNLSEAKFNLAETSTHGRYSLHVEDLNKLKFATNRELQGSLPVEGAYELKNAKVYVDGQSSFLDAKTSFNLKDNLLHVDSSELSIAKLTDMLVYPRVFDSYATLMADYNLTSSQGAVNITALNGKLVESELTNIVRLASGFDLTSEVYTESILKALIDNKKIDFSLAMQGLESHVKVPKGFADIEKNYIDSNFDVKVQHRDFKGSIKGALNKPKVKLDASDYLKKKIEKEIGQKLPEGLEEPIKGLLNLFGN